TGVDARALGHTRVWLSARAAGGRHRSVTTPRRSRRPCDGLPRKPPIPGVSEAASACPGRLRDARAYRPQPTSSRTAPPPRRPRRPSAPENRADLGDRLLGFAVVHGGEAELPRRLAVDLEVVDEEARLGGHP